MSTATTTAATVAKPADTKPTLISRIRGMVPTLRLPTLKEAGITAGAVAALFVVGAFLLPDAPAPANVVAEARERYAPLAAADDGVSKMGTAARDGVDRGFDWVMAKIGL